MTEENYPTRRSLRLARQAAERAAREARLQEQLQQVSPGNTADQAPKAATANTPDDSGAHPSLSPVATPSQNSDPAHSWQQPRTTPTGDEQLDASHSPVAHNEATHPYSSAPISYSNSNSTGPVRRQSVLASAANQTSPPSNSSPHFAADHTAASATPDETGAIQHLVSDSSLNPFDNSDEIDDDEQMPQSISPHVASLNFENLATDRTTQLSHARRRRGHRVFKAIALSLVAFLVFTVSGAAAIYKRFNGNIDNVEINNLINGDDDSTFASPNDPNAGEALNYLVIGVDDRSGKNGKLTDNSTGGSRSDTTMVLHISKNRKRVEVVSIPRDTMLNIPACKLTGGGSTNPTFGMFNTAYAYGYDQGGDYESAIACTWRTVQENSGVKIDGAIMVDFAGFAQVVDSIGGVYMCIPEETISDDAGKLHLMPGWQTLKGKDALNYARARKGTGQNFDGSDLTRTGRQQQMVAAIFNQVMEDGILSSPQKLFSLADAVTQTLTVTETLSDTKDLVGLAYSLRNLRSKNITFMTIPYEAYPADTNRVQMSAEADIVWQAMKADKSITNALGTDSDEDTKTTSSTTSTSTSSSDSTATATKTPGRDAFSADDTTAVCSSPATEK